MALHEATARRLKVALALGTVYVVWGSTYLAIRFAIETLPPMLMAGFRFLLSGAMLYAWARLRGAGRPAAVHWRSAAVIGGLLLLAGNGIVVWAEQWVDSGLTALLVSTEPLWIVLLAWLRQGGARPGIPVWAGIVLGFAGMGLLVNPGNAGGAGGVSFSAAALLVAASFCWASGSLYSRRAPLPASPVLGTGMEMLAGGAMLLVLGLALGEAGQLDLAAVSLRSLLGFAYLVLFGAIAFTAYIWVLKAASPALVSTYAYVNPLVAVLLGWALAGEALTARTGLAALIIISGVALITASTSGGKSGGKKEPERAGEPARQPGRDEAPARDRLAPARREVREEVEEEALVS